MRCSYFKRMRLKVGAACDARVLAESCSARRGKSGKREHSDSTHVVFSTDAADVGVIPKVSKPPSKVCFGSLMIRPEKSAKLSDIYVCSVVLAQLMLIEVVQQLCEDAATILQGQPETFLHTAFELSATVAQIGCRQF